MQGHLNGLMDVWEPVELQTLTSVNSIDITTTKAFFTTGNDVLIRISDVVASTSENELRVRVAQGGTFVTGAAAYQHVSNGLNAASAAAVITRATGVAHIVTTTPAQGVSNQLAQPLEMTFLVVNPAGSGGNKHIVFFGSYQRGLDDSLVHMNGVGMFQTNTCGIDGVQVFMSTGKIDKATVNVYLLKRPFYIG